MTFTNEQISVADKARIDFSLVRHPINHDPVTPNKWTIDRERDIALIPLGGGNAEMPYIFAMYWQGELLYHYLYAEKTGSFNDRNLQVSWRIDQVDVPDNVSREDMLKTLKDALLAYGYMSADYRYKVKAVHFVGDWQWSTRNGEFDPETHHEMAEPN